MPHIIIKIPTSSSQNRVFMQGVALMDLPGSNVSVSFGRYIFVPMMLANWYMFILSCRCHYCNVVNWIIINPVIKNGCWFCNETRIRASSGRIIHYKTWPSIDTYLFFKFEVRKNFGLSQLDKDGIEISCASYFCLLNVNWH